MIKTKLLTGGNHMLEFIKEKEEMFKNYCNEKCSECKLVKYDFVNGKNESCFQIYGLICKLNETIDENEKLKEINFEQFCLLQKD